MALDEPADLASAIKAWRGKVPLRVAAEVLGIPRRTLENIEQGRRFPYPTLLFHFLNTVELNDGQAS
jgi:transcriptional regulator with XRE-family HTH domain